MSLPWLLHVALLSPEYRVADAPAAYNYLQIAADLLTFAAYTAIPLLLLFFAQKRKSFEFSRATWLFAALIFSGGLVQLMDAMLFYLPWHGLSTALKVLTAILALAAVVALIKVVSQALRLPETATMHEAAQRADALWAAASAVMPSGMILVDRDGAIVMANDRAAEMFGYSAQELSTTSIEALVPDSIRDKHVGYREDLSLLENRGMAQGRFVRGVRKDGALVPIEVTLAAVDELERPMTLASIQDISERRAFEQALVRANDALQATNDEMAELVYTVSHDLKSPVVSVRGFGALLREALDGNRQDAARQHLNRVEQAVEQLAVRVEALLSYSRLGSHAVTNARTNMRTVVDELTASLQRRFVEHHASLSVEGTFPEVHVAQAAAARILENLLVNTLVHAAPEAVDVADKPFEVVVRGTCAEEGWVLSVADNGPGIDPAHHEIVFALFHRLSTDKPGTGIGLASVAKLARQVGGRAWIESTPQVGTTVKVLFPQYENTTPSHAEDSLP